MISVRLAVMMFLQFFVWGAWFVSTGIYLPEVEQDELISKTYAAAYFAAAVAPMFFTYLADRVFPAQVVLGGLHLLGGGFLFAAGAFGASQFAGGEPTASPTLFVVLMFAHMCCYAPTLGLTNTIAFHSMSDADAQFPRIRVNGTIGWIVAGLTIGSWLGVEESASQYYVAGVAAVILGLYAFTLPNTPPAGRGQPFSFNDLIGASAFRLFKNPSFVIFLIGSTLICLPLSLYYSYAANCAKEVLDLESATSLMSLGQMSEVAFMVAMPWFFRRLGVKWMLIVGMLAWVLRYGIFSAAVAGETKWMIVLGILVHGICYDFFFVTGQLYVDKVAPKAIRSQAQGLLVLAIYGIGFTAGSYLSKPLADTFPAPDEPTKTIEVIVDGVTTTETGPRFSYDWEAFWVAPAGFALGIALLFAIFFRNPRADAHELADEDDVEPERST